MQLFVIFLLGEEKVYKAREGPFLLPYWMLVVKTT